MCNNHFREAAPKDPLSQQKAEPKIWALSLHFQSNSRKPTLHEAYLAAGSRRVAGKARDV